jgi:hypothetical protein
MLMFVFEKVASMPEQITSIVVTSLQQQVGATLMIVVKDMF